MSKDQTKKELKDGVKYDAGKMRYDLIPGLPLFELSRVYTIGAKKYDDNNWRKGIKFSRIIAALQRHLEKWKVGWRDDATDGQHHLSSVMWCAATLMQYEWMCRENKEFEGNFDDRIKDFSVPNEDGEDIWDLQKKPCWKDIVKAFEDGNRDYQVKKMEEQAENERKKRSTNK